MIQINYHSRLIIINFTVILAISVRCAVYARLVVTSPVFLLGTGASTSSRDVAYHFRIFLREVIPSPGELVQS